MNERQLRLPFLFVQDTSCILFYDLLNSFGFTVEVIYNYLNEA